MEKISISIAKGKGSIRHNNREFITENVNRNKINDNIIYKQESILAAYEKCFGKAIEEYNFKQKRSDRKIDGVQGYMEQVRTSGNGEKLFYENVIQVGNMQDCGIGSENGELAKNILDEYMKNFQDRNPNLYVFNAVLHLDEQTPHLHVDYIPLARGYKNGLHVRNSLDRALKQQGIDGKSNKYENRTISWQNSEKKHIEKIMNSRGLERAEDKGLKATHKSVEYYKAVVNDIKNEIKELPSQIQSKPVLLDKDRVTVKKEDLEVLEQKAKLSLTHEKASKLLLSDISLMTKASSQHLKKSKNLKEENSKLYKEHSSLYKQQLELNDNYAKLFKVYKNQKKLIGELQEENTTLKTENADLKQSIDKKVQEHTEPLKKQILDLNERLDGMCQSLVNVTKAFGMLKYDENSGYKVDLNSKQSKLFIALENYTTKFLRLEGKEEMAVDVEKRIGFSKGIQKEINNLNKSMNLDRGR